MYIFPVAIKKDYSKIACIQLYSIQQTHLIKIHPAKRFWDRRQCRISRGVCTCTSPLYTAFQMCKGGYCLDWLNCVYTVHKFSVFFLHAIVDGFDKGRCDPTSLSSPQSRTASLSQYCCEYETVKQMSLLSWFGNHADRIVLLIQTKVRGSVTGKSVTILL